MPRSNPITMTFPPFAGVVRTLVLANLAVFFAVAVAKWLAPVAIGTLVTHLLLRPANVAHGEIWELATYCFFHFDIMSLLFAMLTLWFCGSLLEGAYGSRWLRELYFASAVGGAIVATALSFTRALTLSPRDTGAGAWAGLFGILIGIAMRMGDTEFLLFFFVRMQAKYMVAIYILVALAVLLKGGDAFSALLQLSGALCGYLYVAYAPYRGLGFSFSEQYYSLRNAYYRAKRRRAARKFQLYMGKQGRKVRFDEDGRYIDPDEERKHPKDKRWMN